MWTWCLPELVFACALFACLLWGTWIVAEQVGYERGLSDWDQHRKG